MSHYLSVRFALMFLLFFSFSLNTTELSTESLDTGKKVSQVYLIVLIVKDMTKSAKTYTSGKVFCFGKSSHF